MTVGSPLPKSPLSACSEHAWPDIAGPVSTSASRGRGDFSLRGVSTGRKTLDEPRCWMREDRSPLHHDNCGDATRSAATTAYPTPFRYDRQMIIVPVLVEPATAYDLDPLP